MDIGDIKIEDEYIKVENDSQGLTSPEISPGSDLQSFTALLSSKNDFRNHQPPVVIKTEKLDTKPVKLCRVCGDDATGMYFGALVCVPCKTFFLRYAGDNFAFVCKYNKNCEISVTTRTQCKYCRYQKCLAAGMHRRVRPAQVQLIEGQQVCVVCQDVANGIHFGVITCEGCKKFFRRGLVEHKSYICKNDQKCVINPRTRNTCRYCRYSKCLLTGMSREAIQMGRPSKIRNDSTSSSETSRQPGTLSQPSVNGTDLGTIGLNTLNGTLKMNGFCGSTVFSNDTLSWADQKLPPNNWKEQPQQSHGQNGVMFSHSSDTSAYVTNENNNYLSSALSDVLEHINPKFDLRGGSAQFVTDGPQVTQRGSFSGYTHEPTLSSGSVLTDRMASSTYTDLSVTKMNTVRRETFSFGSSNLSSCDEPRRASVDNVFKFGSLSQRHSPIQSHNWPPPSCQSSQYNAEPSQSDSGIGLDVQQASPHEMPPPHRTPNANRDRPQISNSPIGSETTMGCAQVLGTHTTRSISSGGTVWSWNSASEAPVNGGSSDTLMSTINSIEQNSFNRMQERSFSDDDSLSVRSSSFSDGCSDSFRLILSPNDFPSRCSSAISDVDAARWRGSTAGSPFVALANRCELLNVDSSSDLTDRDSISRTSTVDNFLDTECDEQTEISRRYWLQMDLPDENVILAEQHWDIIKKVVPAYNRYVQTSTRINQKLKREVSNWSLQNGASPNIESLSAWIQNKVIPIYTLTSVTYCKSLPGFREFEPEDQMSLIRLGQSPSRILVATVHWYDQELKDFRDFLSWRADLFKQKLLYCAQRLSCLELDSIETALLNCLIIIATDYPGLRNPNLIEQHRKVILSTFRAYTTAKFGTPNNRLETIFSCLPEVKMLGMLHYKMTKTPNIRAEEIEDL